jgi:hypothetical protein
MRRAAAFVARGLSPTRRVLNAKLASAAVVAACTLFGILHVRSFREGVLAELPSILSRRSSQKCISTQFVNKGKKKGRSC